MDVEPLSESGPLHEIGTPHPWIRFVGRWIVRIVAALLVLSIPSCIALRIYLDRAAPLPDMLGCYHCLPGQGGDAGELGIAAELAGIYAALQLTCHGWSE